MIKKAVIYMLIFLVLVYAAFACFFAFRFYPKSTINGENVSLKGNEDALRIFRKKVRNYTLRISQPDGEIMEIPGEEYGLKLRDDITMKEFLSEQKSFLWPIKIFGKHSYNKDLHVIYDNDKLSAKINSMEFVQTQKEPKDACVVYKKGAFEIQEEEVGSKVDYDRLSDVIISNLKELNESVDLIGADIFDKPEITKDNPKLIQAKDTMNSYLAGTIQYSVGETVSKDLIAEWISTDEELNVVLDKGLIKEYVSGLASQYDTYGERTTIDVPVKGEVEVVNYNGYKINKDGEFEEIVNNIKGKKKVSRDFVYEQSALSRANEGLGENYLLIDAENQKAYCYVGNKLTTECEIKTAKDVDTGIFKVRSKETGMRITEADGTVDSDYLITLENEDLLYDAQVKEEEKVYSSEYERQQDQYMNSQKEEVELPPNCFRIDKEAMKSIFESIGEGYSVAVY